MSISDEAPLPWADMNAPDLMSLLRVDDDTFVSRFNQCNFDGHLFGGQALGQSAAAAMATVEGPRLHSMHGYFLRAGAGERRVIYKVERLRDGRRFSTRRVLALQNGKPIFVMNCSFYMPQHGFEHQASMPDVPQPESLRSLSEIAADTANALHSQELTNISALYPIEVRPSRPDLLFTQAQEPRLLFWVRVPSAVSTDDANTHLQILAYVSDFWLVAAALAPHHSFVHNKTMEIASLDHALWFHRPARLDDWLLYETDSPSALHGVNLARGQFYTRGGTLVASTAQQALQVMRS